MDFGKGFQDKNGERYMLMTRIQKLINAVWGQCLYSSSFSPGLFDKCEGLYTYEEAQKQTWTTFDGTAERWGGPNQNVWFRQKFTIPPEMAGKEIHYDCDLRNNGGWYWGAPQALAYVNGRPVTGMDVNHRFLVLTHHAVAGEEFEVAICAFTDRFFYNGQVEMNMAVRAVNPIAWDLYYDAFVPFEVAKELPVDDVHRIDIIHYLNTALSMVDFRLPDGAQRDATLAQARDYLRNEFYGKYCRENPSQSTVTCVGHTHIDTAWLWTLEQTRKKVARSFSSATDLMSRYPEMTFMSSQPQLYQYLKEDMPEIYQKVKQLIAEGRWEPEGGMWVEADTNIPCGESLVRQFMHGKRFFQEEFGADNRILWLPDVFGYSAALPQIMKKCGIDYFMTTKISWNEYDKLPYDTFMWKGLDGSQVLAHFICTRHNGEPEAQYLTTYNGYLGAAYVMGTWKRYQQKDLNRDVLFSYGYGDGGGGPTAEMVEQAKRMSYGIPGCPKVVMSTPKAYFTKLEQEVADQPRLPVWAGELYFEYHRGTYTSIAKIKKNMRKSEILLQEAELFQTLGQVTQQVEKYPKEALNGLWKTLLLNQFHDIIPGSSIHEVYENSDEQFATIKATGTAIRDEALQKLTAGIQLAEDAVVVFNPNGFVRSDVVELDTQERGFTLMDNNVELPWQETENGTVVFYAPEVPAKGYKSFRLVKQQALSSREAVSVSTQALENAFFRVVLDENGNISSFYDKRLARELTTPGEPMNRMIVLEDVPPADDAWNINAYINEKTWTVDDLQQISVVEQGPVRSIVRLKRHFLQSVICQDLIIYADLDRLDIRTFIDWKESNLLLKADFPFAVNASRATYDIQFGNVERSTTENTSWDFAQFEVCAHRWADLSEEGFGLSLLNDCKYGYDIKKQHMRLTMLKSAVYPNPQADKEQHTFTYAVYPHAGGWRAGQTVEQAAMLNCPMSAVMAHAQEGDLPSSYSLVQVDAKNVSIEAIKQAENSNRIVVRLNEFHNKTTRVKLTFAKPLTYAAETNLLEQDAQPVAYTGNVVELELRPYDLRTLVVDF